ncbi:MAG: Na+/proline symporter [Arenicella sp.]|jgi:Na+/proline symporter
MSTTLILSLLVGYFLVLVLISYLTSRKADNDTFFTGNKNSKWYLVAFGMIGASLSGVTFISIPGIIQGSGFTYLQMALGYIIGYGVIAFVLLPLYYRLNLTSIYSYLETRFGVITYKIGAGFFILSRLIGAALRMYLVANVLQSFVFNSLGIPFEITVAMSILLIWVYTFKGGIKTIIWTDTLQTLFMLISVGLSIYLISDDLNIALGDIYSEISDAGMGTMWQTEDPMAGNYWWKGVLGGALITLGMTGVDQDMMQKNLTCKDQKDAKKNMLSFAVVLFFVNVLFVSLGGLLFLYIDANPDVMAQWIAISSNEAGDGDLLFATIALQSDLGLAVGIFFLLGLIAAAYSSADSALTSLTTSFSVDFLNLGKKRAKEEIEFVDDDLLDSEAMVSTSESIYRAKEKKLRMITHIGMSIALLITILIFKYVKNDNVVWELFKAAGYTYGPLLGLFMFGIISKRKVPDLAGGIICLLVPILIYFSHKAFVAAETGYSFGAELLGVNALVVYIFLLIFSKSDRIKVDF